MTVPPDAPFGQPSHPQGYPAYEEAVPQQYPQYPGGAAYHGSPAPSAPRNGLGTAGMVCGIVGIVLSWLGFTLLFAIVPLALGILGIVFGVIGRKRAKRGEATNKGLATAGVATGSVAIALTVVSAVLMVGFIVVNHDQLQTCIDNGNSEIYCQDKYDIFN